MAKHPERPKNTSVQQPLLHETLIESNYHDDISGVNFDLMIKFGSKSSTISIGGDRLDKEARSICAKEGSLVVMYKEPRKPVLLLSYVNIFHCSAQHTGEKTQNIRIAADKRGVCMCSCSECTRNTKLQASHIKIDEFRPTIHPVDSNLPMPPPSPLEL